MSFITRPPYILYNERLCLLLNDFQQSKQRNIWWEGVGEGHSNGDEGKAFRIVFILGEKKQF